MAATIEGLGFRPTLGGIPYPAIVTIRDDKEYIKASAPLYSYFTPITGWGTLLRLLYVPRSSPPY